MKAPILFITEVSQEIGMGHLMRCLALGEILLPLCEINFYIANATSHVRDIIEVSGYKLLSSPTGYHDALKQNEEIKVVILDGYSFTSEDQKFIKQYNKKLVCIDDLHNLYYYADVIINHSNSVSKEDYISEPYTYFCLGTKYAMLRKPFLLAIQNDARKFEVIDTVFVNMGGSDIHNNTGKAAALLARLNQQWVVNIVIGTLYPYEEELRNSVRRHSNIKIYKNLSAEDMKCLLEASQLAICPASGISLEVASVGVGLISGYTAPNQLENLQSLINNCCCIDAGNFNTLTEEKFRSLIYEFTKNLAKLNLLVANQRRLIDGGSPSRILSVFSKLLE